MSMVLSAFFIMLGCANNGLSSAASTQVESISIEEHISRIQINPDQSSSQLIRVVHAYEGMADYVDAAKSESDPDLIDLNIKHVLEPYRDVCTEEGEHWAVADTFEEFPIKDLDYLLDGVKELRGSEIETYIVEAVRASAEVLPMHEITVCIYLLDSRATVAKDEMGGLTGFSTGPGKFWLLIYPDSDWENNTHYLVAHEYHHAVWFDQYYDPASFDLLENMVFEGRADTFAESIYPDGFAPWTNALSDRQVAYQWGRVQDKLTESDPLTLSRWMFGYSGVTPWTGYTLGYNIVQGYVEAHPEVTVEELMAMDAEDILAESGFDPIE